MSKIKISEKDTVENEDRLRQHELFYAKERKRGKRREEEKKNVYIIMCVYYYTIYKTLNNFNSEFFY